MNIVKRFRLNSIFSLLMLFSVLLSSVNVFAYDEQYLQNEYWQGIACEVITEESSGIDKTIKYFVQDNSIYFNFNITQASLSQYDNVEYEFIIKSDDASYDFFVNKDGVVDDDLGKKISVGVSFKTIYDDFRAVDIVALDINDKIRTHSYSVYATINGHRYKMLKNISLDTLPETTTKAPKETTTSKSKQTTTKSTTSKASKTTTVKTTKYSNSNNSNEAKQYNNEAENDEFDIASYDTVAQAGKKKMSKSSILLLCAGGVVALIGVALIISALIKNKTQKAKEETEQDTLDEE